MHLAVDFLDEVNRFEILIATIDVRQPLTIAASIIEIQHGCNRINPDTINMIFFRPVKCICN